MTDIDAPATNGTADPLPLDLPTAGALANGTNTTTNDTATSNGTHPTTPHHHHQQPSPTVPSTPAFTPQRTLRIATIGAGYSGMILAHKLLHTYASEFSGLITHTIYESKSSPGGTWVANTYPGVQCDVPAHIYAFPFAPYPRWERFYASGEEILGYFQRTVREWGLDRDVRYGVTVKGARWDEGEGVWSLSLERDGEGDGEEGKKETWEAEYDVLVSARGILSTWRWPEIEGLGEFKGKKVHSADWDHGFDYSGKRIGIVGNGSSAIQILPAMAKLERTKVVSFQRSPTWIVSRHTPAKLVGSDDPSPNPVYREEDKRRFEDAEELRRYRKRIIGNVNRGFRVFVKGSKEQEGIREFAEKQMREKLGGDERLCELLIPKDWPVGCRRVTPGEGYLEAFTRENVELTMEGIERVDETGVRTRDGKHWECDVLVCATGFDVSQRPTFPVVGRDGRELGEMWKGEAESYMVSGVLHCGRDGVLMMAAVRGSTAYAKLLHLYRAECNCWSWFTNIQPRLGS
jgi:cation diffusion facilitator CzcD-associated flavoprotein CzcO